MQVDACQGARMEPSERTIVELNIRHYQRLLGTETDPVKRQTIVSLLLEAETQLASLGKNETSGNQG
jgi:hypothetical protein